MPEQQSTRPPLQLVPSHDDRSEQIYTINLTTATMNGNDAHRLAHEILERLTDLPGLLRMSTTVSFEEPVNQVLVK